LGNIEATAAPARDAALDMPFFMRKSREKIEFHAAQNNWQMALAIGP
jgi:hypothetical protein